MSRVGRLLFTAMAVGLFSLSMAATTRADVVLLVGNVPQDDENVLLNTGISGNPIFGTTNQTGLSVRFASNESITSPAMGQARIEGADGTFTTLTVSIGNDFPPTGSFTSLILNLDASISGTVDFTVTETDGTIHNFFNVAVGENGSNFLTIVASNGQRISTVSFTADGSLNFSDASQFRIGGASPSAQAIPEPTTMLLLGTGLVGIAAMARKRLQSRR